MKIHELFKEETTAFRAAEEAVFIAEEAYSVAKQHLSDCEVDAILKHADKTNRKELSEIGSPRPYEFNDDYTHLIERDTGVFSND